MIPTVSAYKHLLPLATLALASISVFAQAPPKYDATTEIKVEGTVGEFKLVPPTGGKPVAYLVTRPDKDKNTLQIFLCPKKFLDDMGIVFKEDESIQVKGSKVKQDGAELILAREIVVKGGDTLIFRFPDGKPVW